MINLDRLEFQIQQYTKNYRLKRYNKLLPLIEIQYLLPSFKPKAAYFIIESDNDITYPYIKSNLNGDLLEVYPTVFDKKINLTIDNDFHTDYPVSYVSYNIKSKKVDSLYQVINKELIVRKDTNNIVNRNYIRVENERGSDTAIYYYKINEEQPSAVLLSYSAFNHLFSEVLSKFIEDYY